MIKFDWDPVKAASNMRKHGVSFEEARSVFYDEFAVQFFDEVRPLIVCHCEREQGNTIRIISARKATKNEGKYYQGVMP